MNEPQKVDECTIEDVDYVAVEGAGCDGCVTCYLSELCFQFPDCAPFKIWVKK